MDEYIKDNLTTIIIAVCITGGSIILNFFLGCKLYYKNEIQKENEKIPNGIEMVKLEPNNQVEEYIMTIGDARKNVKTEVPEWAVDEYKKNKNRVVL